MVRGGSLPPSVGMTLRMRYVALACDFDGTIATDGVVPRDVVDAMVRLKESGRRLLLVTGRELDDLGEAFPRLEIFDRVVAENGAVLCDPSTRAVRTLADPPPESFVETLRSEGVEPLSVGKVIVATWEPHQEAVLRAIHDLGLELQVVFNKGAVMVLPALVNKASGLHAALEELGLSPHNVVGIGDAENDHSFLDLCELSVAVDNALPAVKEHCDHVTEGSHGEGVTELIESFLEDDLADLDERVRRHDIPIGTRRDEEPVLIRPDRTNVLITGPSGSGKSTLTTGILEQLTERGYQFCLVDPEGDYDDLAGVVVLGSTDRAPTVDEALDILADPRSNLVLNLLGLRLDDRPGFLDKLLPRLQERRTATGRPHWLVIDEAHHLLPAGLQTAEMSMPRDVASLVLVTVHADAMAPDALKPVNVVLTPGEGAGETLQVFAKTAGVDLDTPGDLAAGDGDAVCWFVGVDPIAYRPIQPAADLKRHRRKYAEGDLEEDAFYFTGPGDRLNLRVQNLVLFSQIAEGVDDETWIWHLQRGDYEKWFRDAIGDDDLGDLAADLSDADDPKDTRRRIVEAIEERYTLPAEARDANEARG
jgi:HAD superfamily hydrolase (TIGR01484 family)